MPIKAQQDNPVIEEIFYDCHEEYEFDEDIFFDCVNTFEEAKEEGKRKRCSPDDEEEEVEAPASKKLMTEKAWVLHLADMQEAFNRYIATMREAQEIFEAALSTPQQDASMSARLKRKRSSSSAESEEAEMPARKKRCLEDPTVFPALALRHDPEYGQARFLLNPMSPEATASDLETFNEDESLFDSQETLSSYRDEESL